MSEHDQDSKTEEPTGKQREKFREKGDVAKSQDATALVSLLATVAALIITWPIFARNIGGFAAASLGRLDTFSGAGTILSQASGAIIKGTMPIMFTGMLFTIAALMGQVGINFTLKPLSPNFGKLNPLPKMKTMFFSTDSILEILKSLVKIMIIGGLAVRVLIQELGRNDLLVGYTTPELFMKLGEIALRIVIHVSIALAFYVVLDILLTRHKHTKKMKMTKEEVKQEHKESEGDPQVRGQQRRRQRETARGRMIGEVATANVVVVNPTHYSVAIRYRMAEDGAPVIVAMGKDRLAGKIREMARRHSVPVVSNPPLARGLFSKGKLGAHIPADFYRAVAELLAWVYKVSGRVG